MLFLRLASSARRSLNHLTTELLGFLDALSAPGLCWKMNPILGVESGTQFPVEAQLGKRIPV